MKTLFLILTLLWGSQLSAETDTPQTATMNIQKSGGNVTVLITPQPEFVAYTVFIHTKSGIVKKELRSRRSVFRGLGKHLIDAQIIGEGVHGPEVLFTRNFSKQHTLMPWKKDFITSINALRLKYRLRPLDLNRYLAPVAQNALARIKKGKLYHYTAQQGSIRHTQIQKGKMGENLYSAKSLPEAWMMLQKSPSHLYNILNSQYISFFHTEEISKEFHIGVLIFSSE